MRVAIASCYALQEFTFGVKCLLESPSGSTKYKALMSQPIGYLRKLSGLLRSGLYRLSETRSVWRLCCRLYIDVDYLLIHMLIKESSGVNNTENNGNGRENIQYRVKSGELITQTTG